MKLTDIACKSAKPKDKSYKLSDGGGLYLEITPKAHCIKNFVSSAMGCLCYDMFFYEICGRGISLLTLGRGGTGMLRIIKALLTMVIAAGAPFDAYAQGCFQALSGAPELSRSTFEKEMPGADWNDPSVVKAGRYFIMYASSDRNFDLNIGIYRLISTDGQTWTLNPRVPVLAAASGPAAWDRRAVETPSVVYFGGKYHMFYTGYARDHKDVLDYKIGHAVSDDGVKWVRDAAPILAPTNPKGNPDLAFNQYIVAEPGAAVFNNKIYLYFTAMGANKDLGTTLQVIGVTTSADGKAWSAPQAALAPAQTLYPREKWIGYSTPAPVVIGGRMHLFFDVYLDEPRKQRHLMHAVSADGIGGWAQDAGPIFTHKDFKWTSNEIRAPAPLVDGPAIHLWFAGDDGATLGIGHAVCMPQ